MSGLNKQSEVFYVAVPVETTAMIQGMGIRGGATLANSKSTALQIACGALFLPTESIQVELALFAIARTELDAAYFAEETEDDDSAAGSHRYTTDIPPVALKLVEFYLISDDENAEDEDDWDDEEDIEIDIDLDVYGDFAKYF